MSSSLSLLAIFIILVYIALFVFSIIFIVKQWITMNRISAILDEVIDIKYSAASAMEENKRTCEEMIKLHELLSNYLSEKSKEASQETK